MASLLATMKIEKIEKVYYTKDYDKFSMDKTNRIISIKKSLEESIVQKGIVEPIMVNEFMEILDGQHRFKVAKKHGLSVPFKVIEGLKLVDILDTKATTKNWTVMDFVNFYIKNKNRNYIRLVEKMSDTKLPCRNLVSIYHFGVYSTGSSYDKPVKDGQLNMWAHKEFGDKVIEQYEDIMNYTNNCRKKSFLNAVFTVMANEEYDHKRMVNQLSKFGTTVLFGIDSWSTVQCCIKLRELYNYRQQTRVMIYKKDII